MCPSSKASRSRTSSTTRSRSRRARSRACSSSSDMNGTVAAASREQLRDGLAAAHVGAQRLGQVRRHREVEVAHHLDELGRARASAGAGCRRAPAPIVEWPCGPCSRARGTPCSAGSSCSTLVEQAVVQRLRIAGRQIGAAGAADQQRVAGEHAIVDDEAHRIARVARRMRSPAAAACRSTSISPSSQRAGPRTAPGCARCMTTGTPSCRASSRVAEKWSAWVCVSTR